MRSGDGVWTVKLLCPTLLLQMFPRITIAASAILATAFLSVLPSVCTAATSASAAANAWMKIPTPYPLANDTVDPEVRAARDRFVDAAFGLSKPLSLDQSEQSHIGKALNQSDTTSAPEIPVVLNRVTVSATFTSSQSVLSHSGRSIYTEITFTINRIFEDAEGALSTGNTLTAIIPGGSVQTVSGPASFLVDPEDTFIQPKKRYLLVLSHNPAAQFYAVVKNWDLSSKIVKPNSKQDLLRTAAGKSVLANVSEDGLQPVLFELLTARP
jgi:hypothetical protein